MRRDDLTQADKPKGIDVGGGFVLSADKSGAWEMVREGKIVAYARLEGGEVVYESPFGIPLAKKVQKKLSQLNPAVKRAMQDYKKKSSREVITPDPTEDDGINPPPNLQDAA